MINTKESELPLVAEDSKNRNKDFKDSRPSDFKHSSTEKSKTPKSCPNHSFKRAWNLGEDTMLVRLVVKNGPQNWDIISQSTNNRSGK